MKKLTIALLLALATSGAFAQFKKGRMLVGGSAGSEFSTDKTKSGSTTTTNGKWSTFSLTPQFGYFIIDNLAVGAGLDLSTSKYKPEGNNPTISTTNSLELQPFVRYYLKPGVFFQGLYGIGPKTSKQKYQGDVEKEKSTLSSWALSVGYALFLNDNVAIEPMVGYGGDATKHKATDTQSEYKDIDSGLFFRIGFQIYLGEK